MVWTEQPPEGTPIDPAWIKPGMSVWLPHSLDDLLGNGTLTKTDHGDFTLDPNNNDRLYAHTGSNYQPAFNFDGTTESPTFLIVFRGTAYTANHSLIGDSANGLRTEGGKLLLRRASNTRLTSTDPFEYGDVIVCSARDQNYWLITQKETLNVDGGFGSWGNITRLMDRANQQAAALVVRWLAPDLPTLTEVEQLVQNPWQIFLDDTGGGITGIGSFAADNATWTAQGNVVQPPPTTEGSADFRADPAEWSASGIVRQTVEGSASFDSDTATWTARGSVVKSVIGSANFVSQNSSWAAQGDNVPKEISGSANFISQDAQWQASGSIAPPDITGIATFNSEIANWQANGLVRPPGFYGRATFTAQAATWGAQGLVVPSTIGAANFAAQAALWAAQGLNVPPATTGNAAFMAQPTSWAARGLHGNVSVGRAAFVSEPATFSATGKVSLVGKADFISQSASWQATGRATESTTGSASFIARPATWIALGISANPISGRAGFQAQEVIWKARGLMIPEGEPGYPVVSFWSIIEEKTIKSFSVINETGLRALSRIPRRKL